MKAATRLHSIIHLRSTRAGSRRLGPQHTPHAMTRVFTENDQPRCASLMLRSNVRV